MMKVIFITFLLCTLPMTANGVVGVYHVVDLSCGKYVDDVTNNSEAAYAYDWWVAGFVTGTNLIKDRATSTDAKSHNAWLKKYCENNPLDSFIQATIELNKELENRIINLKQ